eukprot:CAMPEP_0113820010 /NCGR_PEP_ID=MMETSP0328-20130328/1025_1 /TAXON_ID=39455 /ORGANISM="Alexandrium minutum" /LENGTH=256 /DNA_ID=CAMNT_0000787943 /DNA_START=164 /DNA_END=931 /DNA_ORIENTATION=+ /assembly_acc=CAM_ASM_000350
MRRRYGRVRTGSAVALHLRKVQESLGCGRQAVKPEEGGCCTYLQNLPKLHHPDDPCRLLAECDPLLHRHDHVGVHHDCVEGAVPLVLCEVRVELPLEHEQQAAAAVHGGQGHAVVARAQELLDGGGVRDRIVAQHLHEAVLTQAALVQGSGLQQLCLELGLFYGCVHSEEIPKLLAAQRQEVVAATGDLLEGLAVDLPLDSLEVREHLVQPRASAASTLRTRSRTSGGGGGLVLAQGHALRARRRLAVLAGLVGRR